MLLPYQPGDLPAVTRFLGECWHRDPFRNYHPGDFVHWMSNGYLGQKLEHHFHLVKENYQILAVVELSSDTGSYTPVIDPNRRGGDWEIEFHHSCLNVMRERMLAKKASTVTVNFAVGDTAVKHCLEQLGFKGKKSTHAVMRRHLTNIPVPNLPDSFEIRSVAGEHEAQNLADVHNSAFSPKWTAAKYLKVMRTPGFDIERELVVVSPDGRFAAFAVIWLDPVSRSGLFEPVGCHQEFTRRGLTKALMFAGMVRMKAANMETAHVGYDVTNKASSGLYCSVGFEPYFETVDYVLELQNS
ncbi:MAG: GNAT family N-acetyltransferase [Deinococcota bacterium]